MNQRTASDALRPSAWVDLSRSDFDSSRPEAVAAYSGRVRAWRLGAHLLFFETYDLLIHAWESK